MRLLAFADIHGAYDRVEHVLRREEHYDAVVIAGDLTARGTEDEVTDVLERFGRHGRPLFVVAGNMDAPSFDGLFDSLGVGINGRGVLLHDIGFFGVSGSPFTRMHTPYEISEQEIAARSERGFRDVQNARMTVFVPHAPPHMSAVDTILFGKHVGSTAVRNFIARHVPNVVVCGHIHEARGLDQIGPSQVVNCGPALAGSYAVVTIEQTVHIELKG
ncbi:MAG: metallophosphoesterase [Proteobacteria bacterium]|nr:metallophosphoesterase [Pseudomonadota bacterium]